MFSFDPRSIDRTDVTLFYKRHDSNDVRLGELVRHEPADYATAQVVILGCPQDEGVRRNDGRTGTREAPREIRRCLYRLATMGLPHELHLFDLGDTAIQPTLEETHTLQQRIVRQVVEDGKRLVVLGGGNDISYPDCSGLAQAAGKVLALNIDAHFDVRADQPRNNGTPYRQLLEEGFLKPDLFHEIGYQPFSNSPVYERYLREKGTHLHSLHDVRQTGVAEMVQGILRGLSREDVCLFWGFDLDVVCAADAPGVSAPNPTGLRGDELCQLAELAGADARTRLVEFSEINPTYDVDLRTSRLAAAAIWHVLAADGGERRNADRGPQTATKDQGPVLSP